jgi:hypothetical protein
LLIPSVGEPRRDAYNENDKRMIEAADRMEMLFNEDTTANKP